MKRLSLFTVMAVLFLLPGTLIGQVNLGGQVSWTADFDFGFGARVTGGSNLVDESIEFIGAFDYFFPGDNLDYWEVNLNVVYNVPLNSPSLLPYAGGGINIARTSVDVGGTNSSSTDVGMNLLGGVKYVAGPIVPFGELRFELGGGEQFVLSGGILFSLSPGS